MAETIEAIRQQNITNTTLLCRLEKKIQEFEKNTRLRKHVVNFLNQDINYSHLNPTNKLIIATMHNNFKLVPIPQVSYSGFDFNDSQLRAFLEVLFEF